MRTLNQANDAKGIVNMESDKKPGQDLDYTGVILTLQQQVTELHAKLADRIGNSTNAGSVGFGLTRAERDELSKCRNHVNSQYTIAEHTLGNLYRTDADVEHLQLK